LNATRALQRHLEDGVTVSTDAQCETIRSLFVATRDQVQALIAALECDGLEAPAVRAISRSNSCAKTST